MNEVQVIFKIGSRADVSAIPESVIKKLQHVSLTHSDVATLQVLISISYKYLVSLRPL